MKLALGGPRLRQAAMLWVGGFALRAPLLAVPPLLPVIARDLRLSHTAVGLLTGAPVLIFAGAAVIGALLAARLGVRRALIVALSVVAVGTAARGLGQAAFLLYAMTVVMGLGIAVAQPAMIALAASSEAIGPSRATSIYSNGMLVGEVVPVALSVWVLGWTGAWGGALAVWAVPVVLAVVALSLWGPPAAGARVVGRWWPDWRSGDTWRLGLVMGCTSVMYQGANTFLPGYLAATGRVGWVPGALTSLNLLQIVSPLIVAARPGLVGRRAPMVAGAVIVLAAVLALVALPGRWAVFAATGVFGLAASMIFVICLALPPAMVAADQVPRLSAGMFTISYLVSFLGLVVGGQLGDRTGSAAAPLVPIAVAALAVIALAAGMRARASGATARRQAAATGA